MTTQPLSRNASLERLAQEIQTGVFALFEREDHVKDVAAGEHVMNDREEMIVKALRANVSETAIMLPPAVVRELRDCAVAYGWTDLQRTLDAALKNAAPQPSTAGLAHGPSGLLQGDVAVAASPSATAGSSSAGREAALDWIERRETATVSAIAKPVCPRCGDDDHGQACVSDCPLLAITRPDRGRA